MENKEFTVHDRLGPLTVTGKLLVDQRFGSEHKTRWTDMALYQVVETAQDRRVTVSCQGCTPPRTLIVGVDTFSQAPIVCGQCQKSFTPDEKQRERPFRYALEIIARSWVYHRVDGPCATKRHKINTVSDVRKSAGRWRNLYPCQKCKAPDLADMRDDESIAEERQDSHVYLCPDATTIVRRLYHHSGQISQLAAKLLREAARKDPDIATAWKNQRRI